MTQPDAIYDLHKLRILVVEDSGFMAKLLKTVLRGLQVTDVIECLKPEQAAADIRDTRPDMVFIDKQMPGLDGIELVRQIRNDPDSANPYVPILMISAHTKQRDVAAARDAGVTEYLAKPISARAIYDHVVKCLEAPRPFIKAKGFRGPDRRRHRDDAFPSKERRASRRKPTAAPSEALRPA